MSTRLSIGAALALVVCGGCGERRAESVGPVRRVVTLTPSSTELVAAAGGLARLVGVDRYSSVPAQVDALPEVGDFLHPRLDAILALAPDLVVLDEVQRPTAEKLAAAGIATIVLDMHRVADVRAGLATLGDRLGTRAEADRAIAAIDAALAGARARAAGRTTRLRVLAVVDREPGGLRGLIAAGPGSYLDELIGLVGGTNVLAAASVRYPKLAADRVLEAGPDVVLDASHGADPAGWLELARLPAVAAGRVHPITEAYFTAPSPRLPEALAALERLLYP